MNLRNTKRKDISATSARLCRFEPGHAKRKAEIADPWPRGPIQKRTFG